MKNELLLKQAIELLQEVNSHELETVQVNHTKYDDGSVGFTVELTYPGKETDEITVSTDDDELIASISIKEGNTILKDGFKVSGCDSK